MPITIAGSGTITGISAGGLPDDSIIAADIAAGAVTPAKLSTGAPSWTSGGDLSFNSGYGSSATAYGCRAWVNFDGTTASPSTRRGSGNVSSVTKNGTGDYTVNFTTAMPDANYSPVIQFYFDGASVFHPPIGTLSTSSLGVRGYKSGTGNFDVNGICVAIFR